jgi:hypothetical protein
MELPECELLQSDGRFTVEVSHPGGMGDICKDPDGGEWLRGRIVRVDEARSPERVAG